MNNIIHIDHTKAKKLVCNYRDSGFLIVDVVCNIRTKEDFFVFIASSTIPLDPPLHAVGGKNSWDAVLDSVVGGLSLCVNKKVLIVWSDYKGVKDADFIFIMQLFRDINDEINQFKVLLIDD